MLGAIGCSTGNGADAAADKDFCQDVQRLLGGTAIAAENTLHADAAAFRASKTVARPLSIHQFIHPDPTAPDRPMLVSCKVKTPDHLIAEYGPGAATDRGMTCRDANRRTASAMFDALGGDNPSQKRHTLGSLVFDADETTIIGALWLRPFRPAVLGDDGRLHIRAKALRVDWDNFWLAWAPDSVRGAFYCHLIAPEYLRGLVLGEVQPGGQSAF
jgi:hypothetical protein